TPCSRSARASSHRSSSPPPRARPARSATTGSPARRPRSRSAAQARPAWRGETWRGAARRGVARRDLAWRNVAGRRLGPVGAPLAQETLEFAGEDVAGGHLLRRCLVVAFGRLLQPFDERLDVRIALHGETDLPLVVGGGCLQLADVD